MIAQQIITYFGTTIESIKLEPIVRLNGEVDVFAYEVLSVLRDYTTADDFF